MKIAVLLKQTFDTEAIISLDSNGQINRQGINLIINPYDEFAIEEALRIKEKHGGEVTIISVGPPEIQDAVFQALAMGADKAVMVTDDALAGTDEYGIALVISKVLGNQEFDLLLSGWRAIDDGSAQVALRVAEILGLPHVNVVTRLEIEEGKATATREIEGGYEVIEVPLPALITAQKGLNEPRYPTMKGIMQARKKPIKKLSLDELGLDTAKIHPKVKTTSYFLPTPKPEGKIIPGGPAEAARELCRLMREEAKVI
ncbi:electron transfer flavoprotein, beta subunit [Pelotomaculum thermopropionicum SI]|uniref:Electron transfer flavoprotein subunit beta n=1 Tax=Pelotomaculum thermopropionicum (strain DSM 13744 / JCM 10971 / SI) TaxID=370438 RepID=A5D201_PELTS|nr:electron transfer flavoprotein, beta subunit [Pelotomaculum thermopropionicum SI]